MKHSDKHYGHAWGKAGLACSWMLAIFTGLALSMNFALAQEDDADEEDEEALELRDVRVTGSRLNRPPSELSGNLIVLDRDAIRASGELTLARVLRQLPQNVNATNETFGSDFNGTTNKTGASTVNLRSLGSESTLILVDGRRVGYSGLFGGVTDISTIPLSMVERIEILLDGASAVYGSDAVGGVVNIITRKDYAGFELDLNYGRPHKSGYDEYRASVSGGFAWDGGRANVSYEYFRDSGLESSQRDSITEGARLNTQGQKNTEQGPQPRVYTNFSNDSCAAFNAILWELDGRLLTISEYNALDTETQAMANCVNDFTLPPGFQHGDDLQSIDLFGEQEWGEASEVGVSLRPEQRYDAFSVAIDQDISDALTLHANLRYTQKDTGSENGHNRYDVRLHQGNPVNPFGRWVSLQGLAAATPPQFFESEGEQLFARVGLEGALGAWTWQAEFSNSTSETDTTRFNNLDRAWSNGVNSDGVTPTRIASFSQISREDCAAKVAEVGGTGFTYSSFFGGRCTVVGDPPDPINPFADINPYIIPGQDFGGKNEQMQFEALARGELFDAPGGAVALVVGYDFRNDVLDSYSEGGISVLRGTAPVTNSSNTTFDTKVSRDNHAAFFEGLVPLVGSGNAMPGVQRLSLTVSGRYDSYSNVEVDYRQTASNEAGTLEAADPGSEFTWSGGVVYSPNDSVRLRTNYSTSFVAPQLNQLLSQVVYTPAVCLWHYTEGSSGGITQKCDGVFQYQGGNETLTPETADSVGLSGEFSPAFLPGIFFKAAWSDTEYVNRIAKLGLPIVDLGDLPSNVLHNPADETYIIDTRWINIASIERSGMDYELRYEWQSGLSDFGITVRRSYTNKFRVAIDPASGVVHDLVTTRDDSGSSDTVLPPVPKHQTSAQFTWTRGGVFMSIDVQGAAETRNIRTATTVYITEPATNYDLVLGYEFGNDPLFDAPAWLNGWNVTVAINNLTNAFAENSSFNPETGERTQYLLNPFYEWTQGRSYRLSIHKSF